MKGIDFDKLVNKLDRELKAERNQININKIKNIDVSTLVDDFLLDNHDGFEKLLKIHQILKPDWIKAYNQNEAKKPKNVRTFIDGDITVQDIIDETSGDEITELAVSVVISNKIAHYVTNLIKNELARYVESNHLKLSREEFGHISQDLKRYFDPENRERKQMLNATENSLRANDINIESFDRAEMEKLISIQNSVFSLKDLAIRKLLVLLKERDDINYGMKKDEERGIQAFVMDLPYYGQFAVHLKEPKLSKQCTADNTQEYNENIEQDKKETSYEMDEVRKAIFALLQGKVYEQDLYEMHNIMLTSQISEEGNVFLKSLRRLKTDEEKIAEIDKFKDKDPRYYHYLMVKSGYDVRGDNDEPRIK